MKQSLTLENFLAVKRKNKGIKRLKVKINQKSLKIPNHLNLKKFFIKHLNIIDKVLFFWYYTKAFSGKTRMHIYGGVA